MAGIGIATPSSTSHPPSGGQMVWAHNPAAWIGIVICVLLLAAWFGEDARRQERERDASREG